MKRKEPEDNFSSLTISPISDIVDIALISCDIGDNAPSYFDGGIINGYYFWYMDTLDTNKCVSIYTINKNP